MNKRCNKCGKFVARNVSWFKLLIIGCKAHKPKSITCNPIHHSKIISNGPYLYNFCAICKRLTPQVGLVEKPMEYPHIVSDDFT